VSTASHTDVKWRVLVVDPDAATRARVVAVLNEIATRRGESVGIDEAGDGTAALALWSERRHRIVVAEIVLEGTSGLALLRRIRAEIPATDAGMTGPTVALGRRPSPPIPGATWVVIVSQMARDSDRYWGLRQGANAYFGKPFADDALASALGRAFEEAATHES
jgi:twitching motility two-component system response regulator PilH